MNINIEMIISLGSSAPLNEFWDKSKHVKQVLIVAMDLTLLRLGL